MSDDLRTRIAAVLNRFPADMRPVEIVNLEKADAVIRELGLGDPLSSFRLRACADTMDAYWASVGEEYDGDTLREEADAVDRYNDWVKPPKSVADE